MTAPISSIAAEIAETRAAHKRKLDRLREQGRREQNALDARVLKILRGRLQPDALADIEAQAFEQLAAERSERSARARAARQPPQTPPFAAPTTAATASGLGREFRSEA
jgi:hypothetical protein